MKIFFGEAHPELNEYIDTADLFRDPYSLKYFYFMIDTTSDGSIRISDTCGRMIPIDLEHISDMCEGLCAAQEIINVRATIVDRINEEVNQMVDSVHQYSGVRVIV